MSDKPTDTPRKLTGKQSRFVAEYLLDLNASAAARRAGYSENTAHVIGAENLQKPEIAAAIAAAQQERASRTEITADLVLADILRIGRSAEDVGQFAPALRAQELLGKHLGMFADRVQVTGKDGESLSLAVTFRRAPEALADAPSDGGADER